MNINILIFSESEIIRRGLISLFETCKGFRIIGQCFGKQEVHQKLLVKRPDILIIDIDSTHFSPQEVKHLKKTYSSARILTISGYLSKSLFNEYLTSGVNSCVLTECDADEISEAIHKTHQGERFLCGKIAEILISVKDNVSAVELRQISCAGLGITEREIEIIQLISLGMSNKQIAEKLYLSAHTVNTHRKNILSKLGVNNTAGVVMFAVKNHLLEPNQYLFAN